MVQDRHMDIQESDCDFGVCFDVFVVRYGLLKPLGLILGH